MGFGMSDAVAQAMVDMMASKKAGLDDGVARSPGSATPRTRCRD